MKKREGRIRLLRKTAAAVFSRRRNRDKKRGETPQAEEKPTGPAGWAALLALKEKGVEK